MRGWRVSQSSLEIVMSHSTERFSRGTLVFEKVSGIEKIYAYEDWGGGNYDSPPEKLCLTLPKIFLGEDLCFW